MKPVKVFDQYLTFANNTFLLQKFLELRDAMKSEVKCDLVDCAILNQSDQYSYVHFRCKLKYKIHVDVDERRRHVTFVDNASLLQLICKYVFSRT